MCTLSIVPFSRRGGAGFRLVFNRDEQRTRPSGLPPTERRCGERLALMPLDPVGGGTWIAVNDAGLAAALLNVNESLKQLITRKNVSPVRSTSTCESRAGMRTAPQSRGAVVPMLMRCDGVDSAIHAAASLSPSAHLPFRAVLVDGRRLGVLRSNGITLDIETIEFDCSPRMWTSSGLGDSLVERPRRELFNAIFSRTDDLLDLQDAFHHHRWADQPHVSVWMSRDDAVTVSRTIVEVCGATAVMRHQFLLDSTIETIHELPLQGADSRVPQ